MADGNQGERPWQVSVGGILLFTTGIAVSLGLFRLAHYAKQPSNGNIVFFVGLMCLSATLGGLVGRLWRGTYDGAAFGGLIGGLLCLPCVGPWILFTVFTVALSIWLIERLSGSNSV